MKIAVIPARGGSKRIPRKNIKLFCGKPMILWSIEAALKSGLFERVIVSTDDPEISAVARSAGAEVPFTRPPELANDQAPTQPVVAHAVRWCQGENPGLQYACCIYPCAPMIRQHDLVDALALLQGSKSGFAYPVTSYPHPIQRAMRRLPDGHMQFLDAANELKRTQDFEPAYHDCGQFYWGKTAAWLGEDRMHSHALGLPIPHWRVVDIDNDDDWKRAELVYSQMRDMG